MLQNVLKKLKDKTNFRYFAQLASCPNKKKFEIILREAYRQLNIEDTDVMNKFIENSYKFCFSQIKPSFLGFCATTGSNEKLNDLIKKAVPTQKPFTTVCTRILKVCESLIDRCELSTM